MIVSKHDYQLQRMEQMDDIHPKRFAINVGTAELGTFTQNDASDVLHDAGAPICIVGMRVGQTFTARSASGLVVVKRVT